MNGTPPVDRYRGCLVGALVGDCLGSPFEGFCWMDSETISRSDIIKEIEPKMLRKKSKHTMRYTGLSISTG